MDFYLFLLCEKIQVGGKCDKSQTAGGDILTAQTTVIYPTLYRDAIVDSIKSQSYYHHTVHSQQHVPELKLYLT